MTDAAAKLVTDNIHWAEMVCEDLKPFFRGNTFLREECLSVAKEYLCQAAIRYNPQKGKFSSYAFSCMKYGIWNFLKREYSHGLKLPYNFLAEDIRKIKFVECIPNMHFDNVVYENPNDIIDVMLDLLRDTTAEEQRVLSMLLDGYSDAEISKTLKLTAPERNKIKENLSRKMHCAFNNSVEDECLTMAKSA